MTHSASFLLLSHFMRSSRVATLAEAPPRIRSRTAAKNADASSFGMDSVAAHEEGFRKSPQYQEWRRLLHHFYDPFPTVLHYEAVGGVQR